MTNVTTNRPTGMTCTGASRVVITVDSFPTPHLALRSGDPMERERVRGFAWDQAAVAEAVRVHLATMWPRCGGHGDRVDLLLRVHAELVRWRYELALQAPRRLGTGLPLNAERFRLSMRDGGPNYDRLGYLGQLRADPTWDPV